MSLVVQKYGGTSVADADRIRAVAEHVVHTKRQGHDVVVVVSAMGKTTDSLLRLAHDVSPEPHLRELDMLISAGERISMALLCMAIHDMGVHATSFTGSQAGIVTDSTHGKAKIIEVRADRLRDGLALGHVVVVAGFQGVSLDKEVTTMGRGASDLTAVALASALGADSCEIYTDVTGVFTADPRVVPNARRLAAVSYEEMLEMAATGGKVLALRSVEFARNHRVALHVRSSFTWEPGTWVRKEEQRGMEKAIISGVTHDLTEAKVTLVGVPDKPGIAARLFRALANEAVNVDMIEQNVSHPRRHRHLLHHAQGRPHRRPPGHRGHGRRHRGHRGDRRLRHRPHQPGRRGDEDPPGRGRHHVRGPGRRGREHRDDLHVVHPHQLRGARAGRRTGGAGPPRPLRAGESTRLRGGTVR